MGKCFSMCKNNEGATAVSYSYQRRQSSYQSDDSNENEGIVEAMILPAESCREDDIETSITSSWSDERIKTYTLTRPSHMDNTNLDDRTAEAISSQPDSSHNDDRSDEAISSQPVSSHNDDRTDEDTTSQPVSSHNDDRTDEATTSQPGSSHNDDRTDVATSSQPDSSHNDDRTDVATSSQPVSSHNDDRTNVATSSQPVSSHNDDRTDVATSSQPVSSHNDDRTDVATSSQPDRSHNDDRTDVATSSQSVSSHNDDRTDVATSSQPDSSHNDDRTDEAISSQPGSSHNDDRSDEAISSQPGSSHNDDRTGVATSSQTDRSHNDDRTDVATSSQPDYSHNDDRTDVATSSQPDYSHNDDRTNEANYSQPENTGKSLSENKVLSAKFLSDLSGEIGKEWQLLFVTIGLTTVEVEHIEMDHPNQSRKQNFEALLLWRRKNKQHQAAVQLQLLIDGFKEIHVSRNDLADKYAGYLNEPNLSLISAKESCDDVNRLKERLVEINDLEIPLTPLQEDSDKLPVEQLFASVIIKEDSKETHKGKKSAQDGKEQKRKEVKTPEDMLTKNGKPVRRVYMLGDAAHGKTTYCTWLLKKWCNAQTPGMTGRLNEWENALSQFDFVFHLKFRHVDPLKANAIDMICQDMLGEDTGLHTAAKHVLSSDKYRCLIIMDGLDEWKPNQSVIDQLKHKAMPNIDNMSNCVIFTTMRPWMFAAVAGLVRDDDRVIEIQGLDNKGITDVIEKVLVHYYELKQGCAEYTAKYREIISKLKDKTLESFLHIPLLAVVCIQIWCEGEQVGDGLTSFYVAMVNMLIERAQVKKQIPKLSPDTTNLSLPRILSSKKNINIFSNVLLKLGKVAYEGLISKQMKLVFQKDNLESEIGERELKFALDVGLISQTEAPSITTRKVNVHFFHKSVQEFLAVMYIMTQKKVSDNFCTRLCNVKVIMELSNVIMFICGMCPSLGSVISQIVVRVTDSDGEICQYRESPWLHNDTTVKELYKLQIKWYRELQYGQTDSPVTDSPQTDSPVTENPVTHSPVTHSPVTDSPVTHSPVTDSPVTHSPVTFHVSDVYLVFSDTETVRVTRELLSGHHDIRSLTLRFVPTDGERGIPDTELGDFLSNTDKTRSLAMLYIHGGTTGRSVHTLCIPSLRTLCLRNVTVQDRDSVRPVLTDTNRLQSSRQWFRALYRRHTDSVHRPMISNMNRLQRLQLGGVSLGDRGLGLTPHMTDLQVIKLTDVSLGDRGLGLTPHMTDLQVTELGDVSLGDRGLGLTPHMTDLQGVGLYTVSMTQSGWGRLIQSVIDIHHQFVVGLRDTDIDSDSVSTLHSSPYIYVIRDVVIDVGRYVKYGGSDIMFTRVWPLTQDTQ